MSTSNSLANGARLDDCHSTVFSLADLSGIKWHKFSSDSTAGLGDDPVLAAFAKCLSLDILAVWRRSTNVKSQPSSAVSDGFEKELWIFWWGEEPHIDEMIQQRGLKDEDKGCWEEGLTYECRTLLFKAIHNLVERCLLHENFVRLGQWFVKPYSSETDEDISDRFSFAFSFFLHGESSVCTTVEITRHKNLERLANQHIQQINASNASNSVILSPYGLEAKLTGVVYRAHDPTVKKLLDEWKPFYPLGNMDDLGMDEAGSDEDLHEPVPPVVEVIIGGVHMNYPSHFVLVPLAEPCADSSPVNMKPSSPIAATPGMLNQSLSIDPASVSSLQDSTPGGQFPIASTPLQSSLVNPTIPESPKDNSAPTSNVSSKPVYFIDRVRVDSKRTRPAGADSTPTTLALLPAGTPPEILPATSMQMNIKQEPPDVNVTITDTKPSINVTKSAVKWEFTDSFKDVRSVCERNGSPISFDPAKKQLRLQLYNPFHHRVIGNSSSDKSAGYPSVPPLDGALDDNEGPMPAQSFVTIPSASQTISQQTQAFDQVVTDPSVTLPNGVTSDRVSSRPFVTLSGMPDVWQSGEPQKPPMPDVPPLIEESSVEVQKIVDDWRDYKFPPSHQSAKPPTKRPAMQLDGQSSKHLHSNLPTQPKHEQPYFCPARKKRFKLRRKSGSEDTPGIDDVDAENSDLFFADDSYAQHISMGFVKCELSGKSSDPYDFDDVENAVEHSTVSSDISLKKLPQTAAWPSPWPGPPSVDADVKNIKTEFSGKSQLEVLLSQNRNQVVSNGAGLTATSIAFTPSRVAVNSGMLNTKSGLEFSMEDLNDAMVEDEEPGAPTPPQEPDDTHETLPLPAVPVSSFAASQDLQRMFPTPPSLEPAFSPEGRVVHLPAANQHTSVHEQTPFNGVEHNFYKRTLDLERLDTVSMTRADVPQNVLSSALHNGQSVLRIHKHPIPAKYQPLMCLSQIPLHGLYVPSWEIPTVVPPSSYVFPSEVPNLSLLAPPTPSTMAGGLTPGTPSLSSVRTPVSAQPYSVPTPGRGHGGIRSIESPRSYPNPGSHMVAKRLHVDQHGSGALFMNLLLSDSIMNLFWDKSFDQCALCVCNTNTNGADVELGYLPALSGQGAQYRCSCGFSAVRNRMASVGTGLFLEDELEIVGARHENDIIHARKLDNPTSALEDDLLVLAMEYCISPFSTCDLVVETTEQSSIQVENVVARRDECEAFAQALIGGVSVLDHPVKADAGSLLSSLHPWGMTRSDALAKATTFDMYRLLASLKPVLQDAIQKKRTTRSFGTTQHVKGPLTWREFCKEAGKNAEPQPIPSFVVGYDQDWLAISPSALKYWEKLFLEPYSCQKDIVYVVVCPDAEKVVSSAKLFFKELSSLFESYRLGRLKPYTKAFKDGGILRVGEDQLQSAPPDGCAWLNGFSEGDACKLQMYARACMNSLGQALKVEENLDLTSLHVRDTPRSRPQYVPPTPPSAQSMLPNVARTTPMQSPQQPKFKDLKDVRLLYPPPYDPATASTIVMYIIDPFHGTMSHALWRCFLSLRKTLPKHIKDHLILQIVPVEEVLQSTSSSGCTSFVCALRSLTFSTFAQCRKIIPQDADGRSMTGLGPNLTCKTATNDPVKSHEYSLYLPPYVLSLPHERNIEIVRRKHDEDCNMLFVSYCLSHNQKYVLATATDQRGEILECSCINIEVPPRRLLVSRKHRVSVRSQAIKKLWRFCTNISSRSSTKFWRMVIGKLGRLSHGEIRDWAKYLNRKSLLSSSRRNHCAQCKFKHASDTASIISACLTSLEPDASLRIMTDVVQNNNFGRSATPVSQSTQLKTPEDVSCTHIYVFPTSADTQIPGSNQPEEDAQADASLLPVDVFNGLVDEDIFSEFGGLMDPNSPVANQNHFSIGDDDAFNKTHNTSERLLSSDGTPEDASLLQQPLALGYLVSTAPTGPLPSWFWSTCPQGRGRCPVFLRSALHIQTSVSEDSPGHNQHPLDSNKTAVVLRFVLENYNALSWLTRDPASRDRRSCLPLHCLSLMQLYHAIEKLT